MNIKRWFWLVIFILFFIFLIKFVLKTTPSTVVNLDWLKVAKVVDGDTLLVEIDGKKEYVRLIGIDAPEENGDCFANEASNELKRLIDNKEIILKSDSSQDNLDKYGRQLRFIYLKDGTFINQKLIEGGFVREYTYKIPYKYQTEFRQAEKQAKNNKVGMWGACN